MKKFDTVYFTQLSGAIVCLPTSPSDEVISFSTLGLHQASEIRPTVVNVQVGM